MKTIELPKDSVDFTKQTIWRNLNQSNSDAAKRYFAEVLVSISHPMAIFRGRIVKGTRSLHRLLNLIIVFRRFMFLPLIILIVVFSFVKSYWLLAVIPLAFIVFFFVNHIQTHINVTLAARLFVLDELMEEDEEFRKLVDRTCS